MHIVLQRDALVQSSLTSLNVLCCISDWNEFSIQMCIGLTPFPQSGQKRWANCTCVSPPLSLPTPTSIPGGELVGMAWINMQLNSRGKESWESQPRYRLFNPSTCPCIRKRSEAGTPDTSAKILFQYISPCQVHPPPLSPARWNPLLTGLISAIRAEGLLGSPLNHFSCLHCLKKDVNYVCDKAGDNISKLLSKCKLKYIEGQRPRFCFCNFLHLL